MGNVGVGVGVGGGGVVVVVVLGCCGGGDDDRIGVGGVGDGRSSDWPEWWSGGDGCCRRLLGIAAHQWIAEPVRMSDERAC